MPATVQQKLQRALETRQITPMGGDVPRALDFRTVAASKVDLAARAQQGQFSASLFYRLNGITLRVPPLRERRDDIPMLFMVFIGRAVARLKRDEPMLTPAIWRRLKDHDWPGNVRELQQFAETVVLGLDDSGQQNLQTGAAIDLKSQMALYEAALIENALTVAQGDVRSVIATLDLPRKTFYDKVKRLGIDLAQFKNSAR